MGSQVDWQIQCVSISQRAEHLLNTGLYSDCMILVGEEQGRKVFHTHKLILSMASPVFAAMFKHCYREAEEGICVIDIQPDIFSQLLRYMYTDNIEMKSLDQACELCYGAKKYMLTQLVETCSSYIWKDINPNNVCRAYEFATLYEQNNILEKCMQYIQDKTLEVLNADGFLEVDESVIHMILDQNKLNISELELYKAVARWLKNQMPDCDETRTCCLAAPFMEKIRFLAMTCNEFTTGVAVDGLLTKENSLAILVRLTTGKWLLPLTLATIPSIDTPRNHLSVQLNV